LDCEPGRPQSASVGVGFQKGVLRPGFVLSERQQGTPFKDTNRRKFGDLARLPSCSYVAQFEPIEISHSLRCSFAKAILGSHRLTCLCCYSATLCHVAVWVSTCEYTTRRGPRPPNPRSPRPASVGRVPNSGRPARRRRNAAPQSRPYQGTDRARIRPH
jgi:hypothetical protein